MSNGSEKFYKKYNELCEKWAKYKTEYSNYYKDTSNEKQKYYEGKQICEEIKNLRDEIDFRPLLSSFDSIEEYKRILKVINDKYNFVYNFLDNIYIKIIGKELSEEYEDENYNNDYSKKGYYNEDYEAERRARLDMYEDASDITDESDYWDYIGDGY